MSATCMIIDDLKGFFGDVVEHPDDYPDHNLNEKSMVDLLLQKAREHTDFAEYKANLYNILSTKLKSQVQHYAIEDYPIKLSRISNDLVRGLHFFLIYPVNREK